MKTIFHLILIGLCIQDAFGQLNEVKPSFGLGGGADLIRNLDEATSPLSYQGVGYPIGINVQSINEKWISRFEATFILPLLTNNYTLKSNASTQIRNWSKNRVRYQLARSISNNSSNYIGGEIKLDFFFREYHFLDGFGWELQNSFNLNYTKLIRINDRSFIMNRFSIPIVGFIHRKPSLTLDEVFLDDLDKNKRREILNYGSWNLIFDQWSAFEVNVSYHNQLTERFSFESQLGLNFYSISFPEKVQNINMPVLCYINYHL